MNKIAKAAWKAVLEGAMETQSFRDLMEFVDKAYQGGVCYPPKDQLFRAFEICPYEKLKVVILGQDPYINHGEANGLSFSVDRGQKLRPSLKNIYKELHNDLGFMMPVHGDLSHWARQGVLLLNATMSVQEGKSNSHKGRGWEVFTEAVISELSERNEGLVFILWGAFAQKKRANINTSKHLVLESAHPSPLSARRGFFGSKPFSKANAYLMAQNKTAIDWEIF